MRNTDLNGANLNGVTDLEHAIKNNINLAGLFTTTGDGRSIISTQLGGCSAAFTKDIIAIEDYQYSIKKLLKLDFSTPTLEKLSSEEVMALLWWKKWKDQVVSIINQSFPQK